MGVCFADNCKVGRQSRFEYNLPPSERILSENLAPVSDTPEKHPATGTSDGKKTEKTAYTRHSDRMLSGKLFFFLRMANTTGRRRTALFQEKQKVRFKTDLIGFSMKV